MSLAEIVPLAAGGVLALLGGLLFLAGAAGLLRLPDDAARAHAVRLAETWGAGLMLAALAVAGASWGAAFKITLVAGLVWAGATLAGLATGSAARRDAEAPPADSPGPGA